MVMQPFSATLSPQQHEQAWNALRDTEFDVLVIGGGVTGPVRHSMPPPGV